MNILGNRSTPFQVHSGTGHGNESASNPHEKGEADTTCQGQDSTRGSKDTRSNNPVENQRGSAEHANLPSVIGGCFVNVALICDVRKTSLAHSYLRRKGGEESLYSRRWPSGLRSPPSTAFVSGTTTFLLSNSKDGPPII